MTKKTILFDLDGTLADSSTMLHAAYEDVLTENGLVYDKAVVNSMVGMGLAPIYQKLAGDDELGLKLAQQHRDHIRAANPRVQLYPGLKDLVKSLSKSGIKLAVVTSAGRPAIERSITANGIEQYFGAFVTSDDVANLKPHPEPVQTALSELGVEASDAIFIGDSTFDIHAGKDAGTTTVGVTWGYGSRNDLENAGAEKVVDNAKELTKAIEDLIK